MKESFLEMIICPYDLSASLELHIFERNNSEIKAGIFFCPVCHRWYPIADGIPRMLPDGLRDKNEDIFIKKNKVFLPKEKLLQIQSLKKKRIL